MNDINMDAVVEHLKERGFDATVNQTGGGTATIEVGPTHDEEGWGPRYAALAGPGWFEGPGWSNARAARDGFSVGPDDDGETEPQWVTEDMTDAQVADLIVDQVYRSTNPKSYKTVNAIAMGEAVCSNHGGDHRTPISPTLDICYACAAEHGEPVRKELARR